MSADVELAKKILAKFVENKEHPWMIARELRRLAGRPSWQLTEYPTDDESDEIARLAAKLESMPEKSE